MVDCPLKDRATPTHLAHFSRTKRTKISSQRQCHFAGKWLSACTGPSASEFMTPENVQQDELVRAVWYAPVSTEIDNADAENQIMVISSAEAAMPSRPKAVTCGEQQILTTLDAPVPNFTEKLISIILLLFAEQKLRPKMTRAQLKEELCRNTRYNVTSRPLAHFTRNDETKLAPIQKKNTCSFWYQCRCR